MAKGNPDRLLLISTISGKGSGLFSRPYLMAKQLADSRFEFSVVTFGFPLPEFGSASIDIPLGHTLKLGNFLEILGVAHTLTRIIETVKPDLIYAHQPPNVIAAVLSRIGSSIPILADLHGLSSLEFESWGMKAEAFIFRKVESFCARISKGLTVASQEVKDVLVERGVEASKIAVVPNSVDTDEFYAVKDKSKIREKLGLDTSAQLVAFTAPRSFMANVLAIRHIYKIARNLEAKMPCLRFLILGGGDVVSSPPANVQYTGFVDDLNMFLNACDMAIAPYPKEAVCGGARNKVLEYWACGLPIVSTCEGLRGLGDPSKLPALLCPNDDVDSIAEAVARLLWDDARRKQLGDGGREFVVRNHDWRRLAPTLDAALSDLLPNQVA